MAKQFFVRAEWDADAGVWFVSDSDIPGLSTEAPTLDRLVERVLAVAPELIEDNAHLIDDCGFSRDLIDVCVMSKIKVDGHHAH